MAHSLFLQTKQYLLCDGAVDERIFPAASSSSALTLTSCRTRMFRLGSRRSHRREQPPPCRRHGEHNARRPQRLLE
jgi:hypothetical protein